MFFVDNDTFISTITGRGDNPMYTVHDLYMNFGLFANPNPGVSRNTVVAII